MFFAVHGGGKSENWNRILWLGFGPGPSWLEKKGAFLCGDRWALSGPEWAKPPRSPRRRVHWEGQLTSPLDPRENQSPEQPWTREIEAPKRNGGRNSNKGSNVKILSRGGVREDKSGWSPVGWQGWWDVEPTTPVSKSKSHRK